MHQSKQAIRSFKSSNTVGTWLALGTALIAAACSGVGEDASSSETAVDFGTLSEAVVQAKTFSVTLPGPVNIADVALGANATVNAADRVSVTGKTSATLGGTSSVRIGINAAFQSIVSGGSAVLGDRSKVTGDVTAGGSVTRRTGSVVTGTVTPNASLGASHTVTWNYSADTVSKGNVTVNAGTTRDLAPGTYSALSVNSQGSLTLHSGTYVFTSASLRAAANVKIDNATGPVQVYVSGAFDYQAAITPVGAGPVQLLVGITGSTPAVISAAFTGVLLAPSASLNVQGAFTHKGTLFANNVTLQPDVKVQLQPFNWAALTTPVPPPSATTIAAEVP